MKKIIKNLMILFLLVSLLPIFVACNKNNRPNFPIKNEQSSSNLPSSGNSSSDNSSNNNNDSVTSNDNQNNNSSPSENDQENSNNNSDNNPENPSNKPSDSTENQPSQEEPDDSLKEEINQNPFEDYKTITFDDGIIISSTSLIKNETTNNFMVKNGTSMKFYIDLEESDIIEIFSTTNELYFFDKSDNTIISAIKINNQVISLSMINSYFTIISDTNISFIKSKLSLSSIIICNKYSTGFNDTLYKKFNYKSSNFRHSLISNENDTLLIDNNVYHITFDTANRIYSSNISSKIYYDAGIKTITAQVETFLETTESALTFLYQDENNNLFMSEVHTISEISQTKFESNINSFSIYGDQYNYINIELVKYQLI